MTGDTVGGVWTYTMELAEALGAHGVEVVLAALGGPPTVEQRLEACRIRNLDLLASDFPLAIGRDGNLYYPTFKPGSGLQIQRLTPSGQTSVLSNLLYPAAN